jgi:hypothetical protein
MWKMGVFPHTFLTWLQHGGEWFCSCLCHLTPGKETLVPIGHLGIREEAFYFAVKVYFTTAFLVEVKVIVLHP